MAHQFQSGQLVRICRSIRYEAAEGDYEIVRQLPARAVSCGIASRAGVSRMNAW